jgi:hypothetical protein
VQLHVTEQHALESSSQGSNFDVRSLLSFVLHYFINYIFDDTVCRAVAVAYPPKSRDNGQQQCGSVSFKGTDDYRIESMAAMNKNGEYSSDMGDTAPTVGNEPARANEAPWKRHRALGPASSIQVWILYASCTRVVIILYVLYVTM